MEALVELERDIIPGFPGFPGFPGLVNKEYS